MNYYHIWVLITLILAALPSLVRLPLWVGGAALAGGILHYAGPWRTRLPGKLVSVLLLAGTSAGIWLSFGGFFTGNAVLSFFIAVVFLKWGESRTRRDYLLLIFAAVILAAAGALYWENLMSLIHMLVVVFALTISLVAIHMEGAGLKQIFLVRSAGKLFFLGLPLMLLLFMTFPRIPGPLWDLGLAFGLPIKAMMDRGNGEFGKVKTLQPGGIQRAKKEDQNVLVAEFEGAVPFKSRMYWRGPVFWEFDGETWTLPEGWDNRTKLLRTAIKSKKRLDYELRYKKNPVRYTLRTMPNGGRWLYGLDVPAGPAPEAFISSEFQLLSIRKIDDHEPKFKMTSYLDYAFGVQLTREQRQRGLAWPENTNPRLLALGRELGEKYKTCEEILHRAYEILAGGEYRYEDGHIIQPGPDLLDRYFFEEKRGGAEYLAGSFAMLMRAAGVPARLVSGYRGGTIIALTNFVIVKRSDAHAWVEVWNENKGWVRVEPKDIVLPPEEKKADPGAEKTKAASAVEMKKAETDRSLNIREEDRSPESRKVPAPAVPRADKWTLPDWSSLLGNMQKWVINYNPDRQMDILKGVGMEGSDWLDLMITGVAGVALVLMAYLGAAWWKNRAEIDRVGKSWVKFRNRMEKLDAGMGLRECPGIYMDRVGSEKPELADATGDIIQRYIDIRYGNNHSPESSALFRRQVDRFISMT
ncbi:MAG: DUF3488 domain-containing transglutaminase family protein [Desulfobacter sp.]|nr:MAG: DUF3488 domain-containing transglutaminase family protein [Desulfobacter sp.]